MDAEGITILSQRRDPDMISFNIAININETTDKLSLVSHFLCLPATTLHSLPVYMCKITKVTF